MARVYPAADMTSAIGCRAQDAWLATSLSANSG